MTQPLLIIGCGGHARSLIDVVESSRNWHVHGLVGLPNQVGEVILGYKVIGSDKDLPSLRLQCSHALLGLGQLGLSRQRRKLGKKLEELEFMMPTVISGHAHVSRHSRIGPGTSVGHGAIVNAGATVGNQCILNSKALIEHDAVIGDYCHISTGASINGGVRIGSDSFVGSGTIVREGLHLPDKTLISCGKRIMGWPILETILE